MSLVLMHNLCACEYQFSFPVRMCVCVKKVGDKGLRRYGTGERDVKRSCGSVASALMYNLCACGNHCSFPVWSERAVRRYGYG